MDIPVVYEDEGLLVINKPAGVVVNRAESVKESTLQDFIEEKYPSIFKTRTKNESTSDDFIGRTGIVHRLDKETSGLLLIAKMAQFFSSLQNKFKEREIEKKYLTLAHGEIESREGEIKATVGRLPWNRERFGVIAGGREAVTGYKLIRVYNREHEKYSYLEISPQTGRTHQIRIHLKYIGHPVVADGFYAGRKTYKKDLKFCPRLFLHAYYLKLDHPGSGKPLVIKTDLPDDLSKVLAKLE